MKNGDYKAILKLTKDRKDLDSLVARFQALASTGADSEALKCIDDNFDAMKARVGDIFIDHRDLLMKSGDRALGYRWLVRYEELPYASIVVEEAMKEFKDWLQEPEKNKNFDLAEWRQKIESSDHDLVIAALMRLPHAKVRSEMKRLAKLLLEPYPPRLRYQTLLKFIAAKIDTPCPYAVDGVECEVVPSLLTRPEDSYEMQEFIKTLPSHGFNPSERDLTQELLLQYATAVFPMEPPYEDEEHLSGALRYLVRQYLRMPPIVIDEVSQTISDEIEAALVRFDAR